MYFFVLATSVEQDREVKNPTERVGFLLPKVAIDSEKI